MEPTPSRAGQISLEIKLRLDFINCILHGAWRRANSENWQLRRNILRSRCQDRVLSDQTLHYLVLKVTVLVADHTCFSGD